MPSSHPSRALRHPTLPIVVRYVLLQLPGVAAFILLLILARQWLDIPSRPLWILLGLWVGKDILLFPLVWRFYDPRPHDRFEMAGRRGVALTRLNPAGYVRVQGERWQAETAAGTPAVQEGADICVDYADGLRLMVRTCPGDEESGDG